MGKPNRSSNQSKSSEGRPRWCSSACVYITGDVAIHQGRPFLIREVSHRCKNRLLNASKMIMRHDPSRDARTSIRCGWHQDRKQECTPGTTGPSTRLRKLRTSSEPAAVWVLRLSAITMATRPPCAGTSHGGAYLLGITPQRCVPGRPGHQTSHRANPLSRNHRRMPIIPRRLDQTLPASILLAPHRMK
jgi:hypothetical protein